MCKEFKELDVRMIKDEVEKQLTMVKEASTRLMKATASDRRDVLLMIADRLIEQQDAILLANAEDIKNGIDAGMADAMLDRLRLDKAKLLNMAAGVRQIAETEDILGEIQQLRSQRRGFKVGKMRVSIGVLGMIYESRPNVTVDAAALAIKSGNAMLLRGGKEAIHTNKILADVVQASLSKFTCLKDSVQLVKTTDREAVNVMLEAAGKIDALIPRGGKSLVALIAERAKVPVIKHLDGICHVYIDDEADFSMALPVAVNAKTYRYGICGAMETLLIHKHWLTQNEMLDTLLKAFLDKGVELRVCDDIFSKTSLQARLKKATDADWETEYLAPILSIKAVADIESAIEHINYFGSGHTDSIVTDSIKSQQQFLQEVDSASVMVNTPTCFADGFEYGLGAEIGISTDKLHARGPVGVLGLTTEKFIVLGHGECRV